MSGPDAAHDWIYGNILGTDPAAYVLPSQSIRGPRSGTGLRQPDRDQHDGQNEAAEGNIYQWQLERGYRRGNDAVDTVSSMAHLDLQQPRRTRTRPVKAQSTGSVWGYANGGQHLPRTRRQEGRGIGHRRLTSLSNGNPLRVPGTVRSLRTLLRLVRWDLARYGIRPRWRLAARWRATARHAVTWGKASRSRCRQVRAPGPRLYVTRMWARAN